MPRATPPDARRGQRAKSPPGAPVCAAGRRRAARRKERETFRLILRAKYAIITWKISRCVGMADEGDSKSLVLITRVGSTPTTGTRKARGLQAPGFLLLFGRENKAGASGGRLRP